MRFPSQCGMDSQDEEEILAAARRRREVEETRQAAIRELIGKAQPNVFGAVVNFAAATGIWALFFWIGRTSDDLDSVSSIYVIALETVVPIWLLLTGYRCLVPDKRDRLLLLLAQEARLKSDHEGEAARPKSSP